MKEDINIIEELIEELENAELPTEIFILNSEKKALKNLLRIYKQLELTDKEKEIVEAYRNLVKHTGKTNNWVICDPMQMWSDYFIPKSKIKEKIETFKKLSAEISGYKYECMPKDLKRNDYAVKMLEELLNS